ncbi:MAG: AraC family transcriptional regulator [Bacteroidota bacterium]
MIYRISNQRLQSEIDFLLSDLATWQSNAHDAAGIRMYQVILLSSGNGELVYGVNRHRFSASCVLFVPAYQPFKINATETLTGSVIQFATDFFCIDHNHSEVGCQGLLFNNVYDSPYIRLNAGIEKELNELLGKITTEFNSQSKPDPELISTYIKLLLKISVREKKIQLNVDETSRSGTGKPLLLQLKLLIEQHFKTIKSPSAYASMLNISVKALGKLVKEHYGRTLTEMIQEKVIYEAKHQLFTSQKSIKEIAVYLGYDDPLYFSRIFKNGTSVSPEKYRQTIYY